MVNAVFEIVDICGVEKMNVKMWKKGSMKRKKVQKFSKESDTNSMKRCEELILKK